MILTMKKYFNSYLALSAALLLTLFSCEKDNANASVNAEKGEYSLSTDDYNLYPDVCRALEGVLTFPNGYTQKMTLTAISSDNPDVVAVYNERIAGIREGSANVTCSCEYIDILHSDNSFHWEGTIKVNVLPDTRKLTGIDGYFIEKGLRGPDLRPYSSFHDYDLNSMVGAYMYVGETREVVVRAFYDNGDEETIYFPNCEWKSGGSKELESNKQYLKMDDFGRVTLIKDKPANLINEKSRNKCVRLSFRIYYNGFLKSPIYIYSLPIQKLN